MSGPRVEAIIEFARKTWPNDGAEGEPVHALCDEVERLTRERDATVAELEAWQRAEAAKGVPACFNCGAPCYSCQLYKTVLRERDEARGLVRGVESEDGNFGLLEHIQRWDAEPPHEEKP